MSNGKLVKFQYFSRRLRELCEPRKVRQTGLAAVAGVSQSTAQSWLAGATSPNITQLIALADHFGLPTVDELIRPVPHTDEFCVVLKALLRRAVRDAEDTIRKTNRMLGEPSAKKKAVTARKKGKKRKTT